MNILDILRCFSKCNANERERNFSMESSLNKQALVSVVREEPTEWFQRRVYYYIKREL